MKRVLFLGFKNSCRSQMAEAWAKYFWEKKYEIHSAGITKTKLDPKIQDVMLEAQVPLEGQLSKGVDDVQAMRFDYVVTVCGDAYESCPYFPGSKVIHLGFDDPAKLTTGFTDVSHILMAYRRVRDQIRTKMEYLPSVLGDL